MSAHPRTIATEPRKPIILEFNGLPGTGKSTIVDILKGLLEEDGYVVTKGYHHRIWEKYHYPFLIVPFSFSLYSLINKFSDSIEPYRHRTHQSGVIYYSRAYLKAPKYSSADVVLIDQGIIQDIATIAWLDKLSPTSEKELLSVFYKLRLMGVSFHRVDCIDNIDISIERINSRPSKNHPFEHLSADELYNALCIQSHNFAYIRSLCDKVFSEQSKITIDTRLSPEENAQIIRKKVASLL